MRLWPALETRLTPWRAMFLAKCAIVYQEAGYFKEAEACLRTVVEFSRGFRGPNHPRTERVTLILADVLWQECRNNDAANLQEHVVQSNLKALESAHPRTLKVMGRLGETRRQQGRLAESIELLSKSASGLQSKLPDSDPAIYQSLQQLGATLRACFCFEDAKRYGEEALVGMKQCLGDDDANGHGQVG